MLARAAGQTPPRARHAALFPAVAHGREEFWKPPSEACPHSANEYREAQGTAGMLGSEANWGHRHLSQRRPWGYVVRQAAGTQICEGRAGPLFTCVQGV